MIKFHIVINIIIDKKNKIKSELIKMIIKNFNKKEKF